MAKTKKRSRPGAGFGGKKSATPSSWSNEQHESRLETRLTSLEKKCRRTGASVADALDHGYKRSALAHDGAVQIDRKKLLLNVARTKREADALRERLRSWDDAAERRNEREAARKEEERRRKRAVEEEYSWTGVRKTKRKGRAGPETWKLRGAARPAWDVYDFDTRYVDPHAKAKREEAERATRVKNILVVFRGRFGEEVEEWSDGVPPQPYCRQFLSLIVQLGNLNAEAKKYKAAREAFLECVELEGDGPDPPTHARSKLMRMYLEANRPDSARRLAERFPLDASAWLRYGAALVEYVSWKLLKERGSTRRTAEEMLGRAIKANPYAAYCLAYRETFESAVEYAEEVEDAPPGTVEEAVEYCASEAMGSWVGTDGALEWVRDSVLRVLNGSGGSDNNDAKVFGGGLTREDLAGWDERLTEAEDEYEASQHQQEQATEGCDKDERGNNEKEGASMEEEDREDGDMLMYAGMFRTAMDMLTDAGEFLKVPPPLDETVVLEGNTEESELCERMVRGDADANED